MGTKNNPGEFDCEAHAEPDEPKFTLLARDKDAPSAVRRWASKREDRKCNEFHVLLKSDLPAEEIRQIDEALECANDMEDWRKANRA